jgi:hypothetical protein
MLTWENAEQLKIYSHTWKLITDRNWATWVMKDARTEEEEMMLVVGCVSWWKRWRERGWSWNIRVCVENFWWVCVLELPCFSHFVCVCPPFCPTDQPVYIARVLIFRVAPKDKEIFLFKLFFFIFKSFPSIFFLFKFFFSFLSFQIYFFFIVRRKQIDEPYLVLFKIRLE